MKNAFYKIPMTVALVAALSAPVQAGDPDVFAPVETAPQADSWEFTFAPYFWFAALEGDTGFNGFNAEVDMSFSDIWDALDFGLMGSFGARKGKWGVMFDGLWLKLEEGGDLEGPLSTGSLDVEVEEARLQLMLSYRVLEGQTSVDLLAGAAWFYLGLDYDLRPGSPVIPGLEGSESEDFVDPIIGVWIDHRFNEKWFAQFRGGIGGFGVNSDITWQVGANIGYDINERWSLGLGYRWLHIDYDESDFLFDADTHGFFVGGAYRF
jgi:opacity protein-like surface antigen